MIKRIKGSFALCLVISVLLSTILFNVQEVSAAGFSISPSSKNVNVNDTVTITATANNSYAQLSISCSGPGSITKSLKDVDNSSGTIQVKANGVGTIVVTITAVVSDYVYEGDTPPENTVTKTCKINVTEKSSANNNTSNEGSNSSTNSGTSTTEKPKEEEKSKENDLESLSVSAGTLSPEFAAGTTTYKVELTSDVEKITVDAKAKDSKATVSGTGEHELKIGENNISVTVKAENGSKKTYTVSVYVTEKPQQFVNVNDQEYGILNDLSKTDLPNGFEKATITIDEKEVTALKNEKLGITLLYLQSSADQKTGFYIYENDTVVGEYKTITVNDKIYVLLQAPKDLAGVENLKTGTVTIGDVEVNCWNFDEKEKENYAIVYLLNEEGEKSLYTYENTEGTLQKYIPVQQKSGMDTLTYVFIGTTAVFVVSTAALAYLYINFKKKSISAIKDYYNLKSQDD